MSVLRCAAMLVAVWPLVTAVVSVERQKRHLSNTYAGFGSNVEILPVGDTSGVSSSYSVVETSRAPRREHSAYRLHVTTRNGGGSPVQDSEPERSELRTQRPSSSGATRDTGSRPFRFPQDERRTAASATVKPSTTGRAVPSRGAGDDGDAFFAPERVRPEFKPSDRRKYKPPPAAAEKPRPDGDDEKSFGESKSLPKNIKEIVEERPAESKLSSSDLNKEGSRFLGSTGYGGGGGAEYEKDKHYEKEKGAKFLEGHKSEEGEKAEKGYKKEEAYDKGEKEDYGSDEKRSHVEEKAGEKKGHVDQAQHFGEAFQGNHGEKGVSVVKKGGHKKGKKTSGFHKVHHKDEYKKDEVFYDESHDGGEHEEHQHEHEKHAKEKGGKEKKGHSDTGYHESHGSKKADSDHGKKYELAKGHNSEAGEHAHHGHQSEFAKKGGVKEAEKYGHADAGGGSYLEESGGYF